MRDGSPGSDTAVSALSHWGRGHGVKSPAEGSRAAQLRRSGAVDIAMRPDAGLDPFASSQPW